ncbi:Tryptophan-tRNA ligase, bacterial-type [Desulfovibrio sp. X2]|uniref:tryptophan--tRNA ligase n=1 Tax=Desulfovibrio sp. X2 TaxID=941449 RepID=UPI0003589AD3|nr:tryptophan--tRNA ligase [Desulfovibrio sp. X2]EPR37012.1 Tryptophan-tRNA ligase, bacterial-type [Desulfovibrio sp. X2]
MQPNNRIVSGMRPTGPLHLGHYFGVLLNWVQMQEEFDCLYFVADWHALTTNYAEARDVKAFVPELVADWLAAGLSPERCVLFQQSQVKEHAELHLLLSMITPNGWLERNPTYKEVREESSKDLSTYGFLGYPVLMCTDIIMYKPKLVPVGQDQLPHLELTREIVRRFNYLYGDFFPEPEARLTTSPKLPGLDGRKMSKSYGNSIYLKDPMSEVRPKIMSMLTDTKRMRLKDPGEPKDCNLFPYLELLAPTGILPEIEEGCRAATRGCGDCKKLLAEKMADFLEPIQARRKEYETRPDTLKDIINEGSAKARALAEETMADLRRLMNFDF